ncbi:nucleoside hydrolase-like isoform X1 [Ruditapes philippinarum]|uniref:nucleoside hydrolase-like isoform X1 n=1 Tax=Ruditapes philippinarum TaxID=129788 RepID=UPI00295B0A62|nr:nucleoside hydrolase-like isoform X1 [Ruditapes philippinarum]XP_060579043.1 nucleoside hydrolase-like isoform X1 [Ruditapes philippinarum]
MSATRRKLLIDTDAGVDDAQAILMALQAPDVDVIGITCVMGNADVEQVGLNVLRILKVVDRLDIPVFIGCNEPLLGDKKPTSDYHGLDGFGDAPDEDAPDKSHLQSEHAVMALVRIAKEHEGEVTLACIGPLTNVAMAIRMDSKFGSRFKGCYIMGGNHEGKGNMTTSAEFNFYSDPEAAYVVLNQLKTPITIVTWETCEKHSLPWDWFKEFQSSQTPCGIFLSKIEKNVVSNFYQPFFNQGIDKQYEVVDQYAVACAIFDDVILDEAAVYASVELRSDLTRGQMVVDWSNVTGNACNVRIVKVINMDLILEILKKIVS